MCTVLVSHILTRGTRQDPLTCLTSKMNSPTFRVSSSSCCFSYSNNTIASVKKEGEEGGGGGRREEGGRGGRKRGEQKEKINMI